VGIGNLTEVPGKTTLAAIGIHFSHTKDYNGQKYLETLPYYSQNLVGNYKNLENKHELPIPHHTQ
jgi:hypothetical protein